MRRRKRTGFRFFLIDHKKFLIVTAVLLTALVVAGILISKWSYRRFMLKMYPRTYSEIVVKEAAQNGLEPNLVYAVIRTESDFDPQAESKAGAVGLMQLTPATFEWLQKREEVKTVLPRDKLYDPQVNIRYGCRFLSLLNKTGGPTTLCAYNAGIARVDSWLKDKQLSKDGVNLTSIPYPETRNYANIVEQNYRQYQELYERK